MLADHNLTGAQAAGDPDALSPGIRGDDRLARTPLPSLSPPRSPELKGTDRL
jgi:hypothetical protein